MSTICLLKSAKIIKIGVTQTCLIIDSVRLLTESELLESI